MSTKKETNITVSAQDEAQAQQLFAQYHQIATNLHSSESTDQTEKALADIDAMPEGAQLALIKELSKEQNSDAADVLQAMHELSPNKAMRKEARRGLIRLEGRQVVERISAIGIGDDRLGRRGNQLVVHPVVRERGRDQPPRPV